MRDNEFEEEKKSIEQLALEAFNNDHTDALISALIDAVLLTAKVIQERPLR